MKTFFIVIGVICIVVGLFLLVTSQLTFAHGGRKNKDGCHRETGKTGGKSTHCHTKKIKVAIVKKTEEGKPKKVADATPLEVPLQYPPPLKMKAQNIVSPKPVKRSGIVFPNEWKTNRGRNKVVVTQPTTFIDVNGNIIEKPDPKVNWIRRDQIAKAAGVHPQFVEGNLKISLGYMYWLPYDEAVIEVKRLKEFAIKLKQQREKAAKLRKRMEENKRRLGK